MFATGYLLLPILSLMKLPPRCSQILTRVELSAPSRPCLLFPDFPDAEGGVGRGWKQSLLWMGFRQRYTLHTRGFQQVLFAMFLLFIVWESSMFSEHTSSPPNSCQASPHFYPLSFVFFISWWIGRTMEKGTCKGFIGARIRGACENAVSKPAWGKKHVEPFSETLTNAFAQVQLNGANTSRQVLVLSSVSRDE